MKNDLPIYLFHEGTNYNSYEFFGSHFGKNGDKRGVYFRVWAGSAKAVSVVGDFNNWDIRANPMRKLSDKGVFEAFIEGLKNYDCYKYAVFSESGVTLKADPFANHCETAPGTASKIYDLSGYSWQDGEFLKNRDKADVYGLPMNIYEVNVASWKRYPDGNFLNYKVLADELVDYVESMGYTHVELMPVTEYPYDGSWGYQVTGYFAVSSRFGTPHDFMYLVDKFHSRGIYVIIDWVPAHFPKDLHGLYMFDGSCQYEYASEMKREHKGWGTMVFDYGKPEIQSFLISSADFFFKYYHIDGIRVDAVASMLYLDYDRRDGEWEKNGQGTNINLEAVAFLQKLNCHIFNKYPYALMIAEESTAFPMVTMPTNIGGLGFNFKWNMGWMNDSLSYMSTDSLFRKGAHNKMTFSMAYAFSENFVLPVSHDEVVHGKCSLINKMPGSYEEKFENVKAYIGYMMSHPGKKLLFMGQEFGQFAEWDYSKGLEFFMLKYEKHKKLQRFFADVNKFYKENDAFYSIEKSWEGFEWLIVDDADHNTLCYARRGVSGQNVVVAINFSGENRSGVKIGVDKGKYKLVLNSADPKYGGENKSRKRVYNAKKGSYNNKKWHIDVDLPRYSCLYFEKNQSK